VTFTLPPLDFRSDTVTRPDDVMRAAMASAEVGDNVLDHDPTIAELEERAAHVLGMPAALWVPSGTMANLVALSLHLRRGDRFLATRGAHVLANELGSAAWLAGGMPEPVEHDGGPGRPSPDGLAAAIGRPAPYFPLRTSLLCLENTHNAAGGAVTPPDEHAQLLSVAKEAGLAVHLDGARIWHAAIALEVPPAALTVGVDSVSACFSKGLGAPVGSVVAGSAEFVRDARRIRQMLGGGVRQGGILAAACLVALDRVPELAESHENAQRLAEGLREHGWPTAEPDTNIVLAEVPDSLAAQRWLDSLGIHAIAVSGRVRFVTHRDLSAADVEETLRRLKTGA
jgi:threonine aldolase